ncbi:MAG: response regulator [Deltaproteobacteria bacterium]|nr:response regulator [Deltaproteobacteria bacterium]
MIAHQGTWVHLRVSDTGSGMPPQVRDRIFEPFFTTKEVGKVTGLGLSNLLAIVKSHDGVVTLDTEPGRGTTFDLYFPASEGTAAPRANVPVSDLPRGNGEIVLDVDDEAPIRAIARQMLEAFGYRVLTATDGADALAQVQAHGTANIAAVITDMSMPVMDGFSTIQALRKLDKRLPIIAASGRDSRESVASVGVRQFLPKPYSTATLLKALKDAMEERDFPLD